MYFPSVFELLLYGCKTVSQTSHVLQALLGCTMSSFSTLFYWSFCGLIMSTLNHFWFFIFLVSDNLIEEYGFRDLKDYFGGLNENKLRKFPSSKKWLPYAFWTYAIKLNLDFWIKRNRFVKWFQILCLSLYFQRIFIISNWRLWLRRFSSLPGGNSVS